MSKTNLQIKFHSFSTFSGWFAVIMGFAVLTGWQFNLEILKSFFPGLVAMNPLSAFCFILVGTSILICCKKEEGHKTAQFLMCVVLLISLLKVSHIFFDFSWPLDELLFSDRLAGNKMAPNTALNFLLISIATLLTYRNSTNLWIPHLLILIVILSGWLALIGYLNNLKPLYGIRSFIPMAIHTAFTFIITGLGILFLTNKGFMSIITSETSGGKSARLMLPIALLFPPILAWLRLEGERKGLYNTEFGASILAISLVFVFLILIIYSSLSLNKLDELKQQGENKIVDLNEELRQSIKALKQTNEKLMESNHDLETFTFTASHDLKAPLRHIIFMNSILLKEHKDKINEEGQKLIHMQVESAKRMDNLINNLLEFARISKQEIAKSSLNMKEIIEEAIDEIKADFPKQNIEVKIGSLNNAKGNGPLLKQVWMNLISNAVKYSSKKEISEIEIGSSTKTNENIYFIKDNGSGFEMKNIDKLFLVFQRLHEPNEFTGSGLGLSIVQRIINKHGGKIWAESEPDNGATFFFSLPIS